MSKSQILDPRKVSLSPGRKNVSHGTYRAKRKPTSPRLSQVSKTIR